MKITNVTTRIVSTPAESPLVFDQPPTTATFDFVTLELGTDQGLVGAEEGSRMHHLGDS